ncbi:unnamed protein product, partial [marine sediment metagenome]
YVVPLAIALWLLAFTDFLFTEKRKLILLVFAIIGIIFEFTFFTLLFINPDLIGNLNPPVDVSYNFFIMIFLLIFILIVVISGCLVIKTNGTFPTSIPISLAEFEIFLVKSFISKKAPILRPPPNGWSVQMNVYFSSVIAVTFIFGQIVASLLNNIWYQEVFLILGTIIAYAVAFIIYFSFTTVGRRGYLFLSLAQPVTTISKKYYDLIIQYLNNSSS